MTTTGSVFRSRRCYDLAVARAPRRLRRPTRVRTTVSTSAGIGGTCCPRPPKSIRGTAHWHWHVCPTTSISITATRTYACGWFWLLKYQNRQPTKRTQRTCRVSIAPSPCRLHPFSASSPSDTPHRPRARRFCVRGGVTRLGVTRPRTAEPDHLMKWLLLIH